MRRAHVGRLTFSLALAVVVASLFVGNSPAQTQPDPAGRTDTAGRRGPMLLSRNIIDTRTS